MHTAEFVGRIKADGKAQPWIAETPPFTRFQSHASIIENFIFTVNNRAGNEVIAHRIGNAVEKISFGSRHENAHAVAGTGRGMAVVPADHGTGSLASGGIRRGGAIGGSRQEKKLH